MLHAREQAMTDPESTAQDTSAAAPAPVTTPGSVTGHDPAIRQVPATRGPRRRRRWAVVLLVAVAVLGLAAGLVVWAPWIPPPVLRPAGLVAGPSTANSVTFRWSRPATGPLPDKYLILGGPGAGGSVAGTVTSYRQAGLTPATSYQYRVVAVRGGKRSPKSALLTVRTLTPPISQARLQGSWNVHLKTISPASGPRNGYMVWQLSPACATGTCDVILHGKNGRFPFTVKLARAGAAYTGHTVTQFGGCGTRANSIPDPVTLRIQVHPTKAIGKNQEWAATSFAGTLKMTWQYVTTTAFYCNASTVKASLTGTPA
jgi:Fibronectin type III domain